MKRSLAFGLLILLLLSSCKQQEEQKTDDAKDASSEEFVSQPIQKMDEGAEVKEIIYSMYLPTDMAELFEQSGSNFNPELPASVDALPMYTDHEQVAVMLGILGVDLSYMKILQQKTMAAEYYNAIKILATPLEIPNEIFETSTRKLEKYISNQDSLASVIENVYEETDHFFRENGNDNLASLSLMGGWVEAMYIGVSIYESEEGNRAMAEKVLQQKFTLNSIYSILSNHQESLNVTGYLLMLKKLRKEFAEVHILYPAEGFSVDTTQKRIQTADAVIRYEEETLSEINRIIIQMREEMIRIKE